MRPYGTENNPEARSSLNDGDDVTVKASVRNLGRNRDGDTHNTYRNTANKARDRRAIKRAARRDGKVACKAVD